MFSRISTQLSIIENLQKSYSLKTQQVEALNKSVSIANDLFKSARVDYFEVLMTQSDVLISQLELIETKKAQLHTVVHIYRDSGGGRK